AGIVLGILALLAMYTEMLAAIAVIAFGAGLVVSSNAVWHLQVLKRVSLSTREAQDWRFGSQMLAGEMAMGSAGTQGALGTGCGDPGNPGSGRHLSRLPDLDCFAGRRRNGGVDRERIERRRSELHAAFERADSESDGWRQHGNHHGRGLVARVATRG